jgi:hypothetical protein
LATGGDDGTLRLWDPRTGEPSGWIAVALPDREHAVLAPDGSEAREVSAGAWRWLQWIAPDPATGRPRAYPAEWFGPLPEVPRR